MAKQVLNLLKICEISKILEYPNSFEELYYEVRGFQNKDLIFKKIPKLDIKLQDKYDKWVGSNGQKLDTIGERANFIRDDMKKKRASINRKKLLKDAWEKILVIYDEREKKPIQWGCTPPSREKKMKKKMHKTPKIKEKGKGIKKYRF